MTGIYWIGWRLWCWGSMGRAGRRGSRIIRSGMCGRLSRRRPVGTGPTAVPPAKSAAVKKKLSYLEARDYETIEKRVTEAEVALEAQHDAVQHAASAGGKELEAAMKELEKRQLAVDELYERWAELEKKLG